MTNARSATPDQILRAIEAGEHLPDEHLPIGIHRISATRYQAQLCTGGHKFKGPGRESIKEALDDRRKLCEQTGVDFVLFGKQTQAKGERPEGWQNAAVHEDGTLGVNTREDCETLRAQIRDLREYTVSLREETRKLQTTYEQLLRQKQVKPKPLYD